MSDGYLYLTVPRRAVPELVALGWREVGVISDKVPALVAKPLASFDLSDAPRPRPSRSAFDFATTEIPR